MRVLLIEGDLQIGNSLFGGLRDVDYSVDWLREDVSGNAVATAGDYAVVLLGLSVPGARGLGVLRAIRGAGSDVPVLILTARDDVQTRLRSFDDGADDCVPEPFDIREVSARIRAVLRRKAGYATSRIGSETVCLDLDRRTLSSNGIVSALSPREFALMHALLRRPGTVLSRCQLEEHLYGWGRVIESNAVDVIIHSMRKKFGQSLIRNLRGQGWTVVS
jgi:two-component system, OmpR family, response regulator